MFPIEYIEDNLVFNKKKECYAYYEFEAYNYNFLSLDKKKSIFRDLKRLVAQNHEGNIHFLYITSEESVRATQEKSKKEIRSKNELKEYAEAHMDEITEVLVNTVGENESKVRFFCGFKLSVNKEAMSTENYIDELKKSFKEFFRGANEKLTGDYKVFDVEEVERFKQIENMLKIRIANKFSFRRLTRKDFGYIIEHNFGLEGVPYEEYDYTLDTVVKDKSIVYKAYDVLKITDAGIDEKPRYIKLSQQENEQYVSLLCLSEIIGESQFPDNEILYLQQEVFNFPVDVSEQIEAINNRKALSTVRNKKKDLEDLENNAHSSGSQGTNQLNEALEQAEELEAILDDTKESMYKLSFVIRVSASTKEELERRVVNVRDFYSDYGLILQRPFGDQLGLLHEFIPSSTRYLNDYVQYATSDFIASLGFGASRFIGEEIGMPIGFDVQTGQIVRILPWAAAQNREGLATNALAKAFLGSLGGGKSFSFNLITFLSVLFGAEAFILDPKAERGIWKERIPWLSPYINVINFTSEDENKGILDPLLVIEDKKSAKKLALDVLTFLTGVNIRDSERYPALEEHVSLASEMNGGLLTVIDELRKTNTPVTIELANHIFSFSKSSFAQLIFSDGKNYQSIDLDNPLNFFQIEELTLPDSQTSINEYTPSELLSVAMMLIFSNLGLSFIRKDNSIFKIVGFEEAWAQMQFTQGKIVVGKTIREGRAKNSASDIITQNTDDLTDEKIKNNIGMKFAFRSTDSIEIEKTLNFFGLDFNEDNSEIISSLDNGQCLFQDVSGRVSVVQFDSMSDELDHAFDTRPKMEEVHEEGENETN